LGFFEGKEKMVAGADNYNASIAGDAYFYFPGQRSGSVYLYFILIFVCRQIRRRK
jgi:hypothetical protein